jgi:hypothetical protein
MHISLSTTYVFSFKDSCYFVQDELQCRIKRLEIFNFNNANPQTSNLVPAFLPQSPHIQPQTLHQNSLFAPQPSTPMDSILPVDFSVPSQSYHPPIPITFAVQNFLSTPLPLPTYHLQNYHPNPQLTQNGQFTIKDAVMTVLNESTTALSAKEILVRVKAKFPAAKDLVQKPVNQVSSISSPTFS